MIFPHFSGNISTSHYRVLADSVEVDLRPRFPLFGGWKTIYILGYNIPSYEYLFNSGEDSFLLYILLMLLPKLSCYLVFPFCLIIYILFFFLLKWGLQTLHIFFFLQLLVVMSLAMDLVVLSNTSTRYILLHFDAPVLLVQLVTWTLLHSVGQSGSHLENTPCKTQSQFSVSISVISDRNLCIYLSSVVTLVGGSMLGLHLGVQSLAKFCTL